MSASGIGVIDTTSMWAAGSLIYPDPHSLEEYSLELHPNRELHSTKQEYFLSLLRNIVLYEELRTDTGILSSEFDWYRRPVERLMASLSSVIRLESIPDSLSDVEIMNAITPTFVSKTSAELNSERPSPGTEQIQLYYHLYSSRAIHSDASDSVYSLSDNSRGWILDLIKDICAREPSLIEDQALPGIMRNLSILSRTIRYAAHSNYVNEREKRPSAFCAAPRRIELLQDYCDEKYFRNMLSASNEFNNLFAKLRFPRDGYSFEGFSSDLELVSLTDLWSSVSSLEPQRALDKVLRLRETSEAKELRETWGQRLWRGGNTALEGYGQPIRMSMENVNAQGDVIQIVALQANVPSLNLLGGIETGNDTELRKWIRSQIAGE